MSKLLNERGRFLKNRCGVCRRFVDVRRGLLGERGWFLGYGSRISGCLVGSGRSLDERSGVLGNGCRINRCFIDSRRSPSRERC